MKKYLLKILPYLLAFFFGLLLYIIAVNFNEDAKALFINISSAFIAIPLLYLIYELTQEASKKKLNREIIDYAKVNIDRELLTICHQLIKLIYPYEVQNKSLEGIKLLLNLTKEDIKKELENNEYIGFQVLKNWFISKDKIQNLLNSSFIIGKLNDDLIISIIMILKDIRAIKNLYSNNDTLYKFKNYKVEGFKIVSGLNDNPESLQYLDKYLLLKELGNSQYQVYDFGNFEKFKLSKLLLKCVVNTEYISLFSDLIYDVLKSIKSWVNGFGGEFLIDTRMYKFRKIT